MRGPEKQMDGRLLYREKPALNWILSIPYLSLPIFSIFLPIFSISCKITKKLPKITKKNHIYLGKYWSITYVFHSKIQIGDHIVWNNYAVFFSTFQS